MRYFIVNLDWGRVEDGYYDSFEEADLHVGCVAQCNAEQEDYPYNQAYDDWLELLEVVPEDKLKEYLTEENFKNYKEVYPL